MSQTSIELTTTLATAHDSVNHGELLGSAEARPEIRKGSTVIIFTTISGVTAISSLLAGLITVTIPKIGKDLDIPTALLLWPTSIYALTCGCTLILSGAIADVVGSRVMYLTGCLLQSAFTLACGLAQSTFQLILFRALAGIAIAFCLPSAVSLITTYFPHGKRRNLAFASMGGGQPIGFSLGLVIGGVLADGPGWRYGFYIAAGINTAILIVALWGLPKSMEQVSVSWRRLKEEIDWIGALLLSVSLAMLSYVFAALTGSVSTIHSPTTIALLTTALALIPAFVLWVGKQERAGRPAIIPNSLWRNPVFSAICADVFLLWGAFNSIENLLTFFFQDVQSLSATETSLRFLPTPVAGLTTNIVIGLITHKTRANWAVVISILLSSLSPVLVAVMKPQDPYWEFVFPAIFLNAIGPDVLFTISNLVITAAFPDRTQALAGGVFNTVAQVGKSVGVALSAVIANSVTLKLKDSKQSHALGLFAGYQAAWWFCLGTSSTALLISIIGLRNIGRIGVKRD